MSLPCRASLRLSIIRLCDTHQPKTSMMVLHHGLSSLLQFVLVLVTTTTTLFSSVQSFTVPSPDLRRHSTTVGNGRISLFVKDDDDDDDDEFHPNDPAHTTPQLMAAIWDQIKHGATMEKGVSHIMVLLVDWLIG